MPQSLSKVYVHITFSTKNREKTFGENIQPALFEYLGGICKGLDCNPIRVGGTDDHIHILCTLSRKITQASLIEQLKVESSKWMKTKGINYRQFYWQHGYGIFSVNPTEIEAVVNYINNQREHHRSKTFQEEYRAFLKKYHVDYDERFAWD